MCTILKKIIALLFIFLPLVLSSCESNNNSDESRIKLYGTISKLNDSIIFREDGDYYQLILSNLYYVNVTSNTKIVKQRESCSGFYNASVNDLAIGDVVVLYYSSDNISYKSEKTIVRPALIEVYHKNCINGSVASESSSNCYQNCWMD